MRDIEHMKNPLKKMYDKFSNRFDKYIYDLVQQGHAYKIHGSIEESGFSYSNVKLTDEIKEKFNIDSEYTDVIMQENSVGLIDTYLVFMKPTGFQNEMSSTHKRYKSEISEEE